MGQDKRFYFNKNRTVTFWIRSLKVISFSMLISFSQDVEAKGNTIVPLRLFLNENGWAKLEVALAKGKKVHDKRETIKNRDSKRDLARIKKTFNT